MRSVFASLFLLMSACGTTAAATTYAPVTGIYIRADSLVDQHGCGTASGQVYKYAAIVYDHDNHPQASGLYDCFADGVFANLTGSATGSYAFTLQVFTYDQTSYDANSAAIVDAASRSAATTDADVAVLSSFAIYRTHCGATQQQSVQVLAVCDPLQKK